MQQERKETSGKMIAGFPIPLYLGILVLVVVCMYMDCLPAGLVGGMIALMVRANASFSYPGTIIYASALYTFYTMALAIVNLVKYRRLGSPILSAATVQNLVSAMMSILGLQTAMISQFDPGNEAFRKTMNTMTGSVVYGVVILIALWMLRHGGKERKNVE